MKCQKCGTEHNANFCPNCGTAATQQPSSNFRQNASSNFNHTTSNNNYQVHVKNDKSINTIIIILVALIVFIVVMIGVLSDEETENSILLSDSKSSAAEITYEKIELKILLKELEENAMKAEEKYQDTYIETSGVIESFDSDGKYICIEPNGDKWAFYDNVQCFIANDEQKQFLLQKKVGDFVTIKGQITSIGEFLGYDIDINEIS